MIENGNGNLTKNWKKYTSHWNDLHVYLLILGSRLIGALA